MFSTRQMSSTPAPLSWTWPGAGKAGLMRFLPRAGGLRTWEVGTRPVSWAQPPARMQADWQDYREAELFLGEALSTGQERDHQWGEQLREADWKVE